MGLGANPYQSRVLYQATYRELDINTIDKLCNINERFDKFISMVEILIKATPQYYNSTKKELEEFCDKYFTNENEVEKYC